MRIRPVAFVWREVGVVREGGDIVRAKVMVPNPRFNALCSRQFDLGEEYPLGPVEGVPSKSRGGFFKSIKEAWKNLPEEDDRFPDAESLRKRALVRAGWAQHSQTVMDTPKDAKVHAMGLRKLDGYAVIKVSGNVVDCWIAKSIAAGQISGEEWRVVKTKALDWVSSLARTTREELEAHVERRDG